MRNAVLIWLVLLPAVTCADEKVDKLAEQVRSLVTVLPQQQAAATARDALEHSLKKQLRTANTSSSAEWAKITSREEWEKFRAAKLAALRASLALPEERLPVKPHITGTLQGEGYTIRKVVYASRPHWFITANLYVPAKPPAKAAGILLSHSHHSPKSQGELQDMGATWARAGCYVLVPDHLGHGERREHPFAAASDYAKEFPLGRQDYHFRYDNSLQLYLAGESLMGWLVHDLMAGVDVLLAQEGIDPAKIILLGGVAGGGDPAAVAGALDERIACVGPFNFGGPQPETRYSLPDDAETSFAYAGGGSWESTRNLADSAREGVLPWVIVGSIAPRKLIYGHEFRWDGERDPVWKRLQAIWKFYDDPTGVAVAHGQGNLQGKEPESSHCGNIGALHRRMIHPLLAKWFDIHVTPEDEYSHRFTAKELACWDAAAELRAMLQPLPLRSILAKQVEASLQVTRKELAKLSNEQRRAYVARELEQVLRWNDKQDLGNLVPEESTLQTLAGVRCKLLPIACRRGPGACLLLTPEVESDKPLPLVLAVGSAGSRGFLAERSQEIAELLESGFAVCLADVSALGQLAPDNERGQSSALTSLHATALMLGRSLVADQVSDLRDLLRMLRELREVDGKTLYVWGESFAKPLASGTPFPYPRRVDRPGEADAIGGLLALIVAAQEPQVQAVLVRGGLGSYRELLESPFVQVPHAAIVPGLLTRCDLPEIVAALRPLPVRLEALVDGRHRLLSDDPLRATYQHAWHDYTHQYAPNWLSLSERASSPADFFAQPRKPGDQR